MLISLSSGISELMLYLLIVNVIVLNVLIGVSFVMMCMMLNSICVRLLMKLVIIWLCLLRCVSMLLNSSVISRICRILFCVNVLIIVFGMMCIRKLIVDCLCVFVVYDVMVLLLSVVGLMLKLMFGCSRCVVVRLSSSVKVDMILKYSSVLLLMWLIFFMFFMLVMLVMIV